MYLHISKIVGVLDYSFPVLYFDIFLIILKVQISMVQKEIKITIAKADKLTISYLVFFTIFITLLGESYTWSLILSGSDLNHEYKNYIYATK